MCIRDSAGVERRLVLNHFSSVYADVVSTCYLSLYGTGRNRLCGSCLGPAVSSRIVHRVRFSANTNRIDDILHIVNISYKNKTSKIHSKLVLSHVNNKFCKQQILNNMFYVLYVCVATEKYHEGVCFINFDYFIFRTTRSSRAICTICVKWHTVIHKKRLFLRIFEFIMKFER